MISKSGPLVPYLHSLNSWMTSGDVEWIPLGLQFRNDTELGISRHGFWTVGNKKMAREIVEDDALVPLLVCLEIPPEDFEVQLLRCLEQSGIPRAAFDVFPKALLIDAGIRSSLPYWAELAMNWAEQSPRASVSPEALASLAKAKWATQRLRQRARRLLVKKS